MIEVNKILQGDWLSGLKSLPDSCIDCCVTSPPYWGLRDYGVVGQLGLEKTPEEFISKLVEGFEEVRRVLKPTGTLWLNLGDSYNAASSNQNSRKEFGSTINNAAYYTNGDEGIGRKKLLATLKAKDLVGIPWMAAFALRAAGWYLRQDIIWAKPNPMPESVTDRCTKSHEYIFLLSKSKTYFYDAEAIKVDASESFKNDSRHITGSNSNNDKNGYEDVGAQNPKGPHRLFTHKNLSDDTRKNNSFHEARVKGYAHRGTGDQKLTGHSGNFDKEGNLIGNGKANKRSVWTVTTKPFSEAHFATFPEDLIVDCIKAGCPENGIVLDPFSGAGTTALVARKLNRNFVGIELNPKYIEIAERRLKSQLGMFA